MAFGTLKLFDAYPKLRDGMSEKTFSGATVSIIAGIVIIILFYSEMSIYTTVNKIDHLNVDLSTGEKLRINFDIFFPHIPCNFMSLDAMDVSGTQQMDVSHNIIKKPFDKNGYSFGIEMKHEISESENTTSKNPLENPDYCGDCYGAEEYENQCCNTCDDVHRAYHKKMWVISNTMKIEQCVWSGQVSSEMMNQLKRGDGCQMYGHLEVNKVAGNFHFAPGKSYQHQNIHIHDLANMPGDSFNMTHRINKLSFGEDFPGRSNSLDNITKVEIREDTTQEYKGGMYTYYVKVVPTTYSYLSGEVLKTNQFSVTEHYKLIIAEHSSGLPGAFFFYDISHMMVHFTESRESFPHFLTQLCAILGGVFTVAGLINRVLHSSINALKSNLGKQS